MPTEKGPFIIGRRQCRLVRGVRTMGSWTYWTAGIPRTSFFITDAYRFTTYKVALECTGTHVDLRDSDEWRVLRADGKNPVRRQL
ncbi:MAG: hypothetical protein KGL39_15560 [Patescibacteria group bacterium]|nr:hypothetical protein [Patescibacteria group bacterium]